MTRRAVKNSSATDGDVTVRRCEACATEDVACDFYEDIKVSPRQVVSKWLCQICAESIFGVILLQSREYRNHGGFHIDPVLVKGIVQSLHAVVKMVKESA